MKFNDSCLVLIINLSVCDFIYCCIALPINGLQFIYKGNILSQDVCLWHAIIRNIVVTADYVTVSVIAISRCGYTTKFKISTLIQNHAKSFVILIWIYSFGLLTTYYHIFKAIQKSNIDSGNDIVEFSCDLGMCDFVGKPHVFTANFCFFGFPCITIAVCYIYIGCYFQQCKKHLQTFRSGKKYYLHIVNNSAAQFIVFREKRKMDRGEILREKWVTKNPRKIAGKTVKNGPILG